MKDRIYGMLGTVATCAVIALVVFAVLDQIVDLEFVSLVVDLSGKALTFSAYVTICIWIGSFDWGEAFFWKATASGIIFAATNYIVYAIYGWELFYSIFVVSALVAAIAIVIGVIKAIFG